MVVVPTPATPLAVKVVVVLAQMGLAGDAVTLTMEGKAFIVISMAVETLLLQAPELTVLLNQVF